MQPPQETHAVVDSCGEAVLGREAVLRGEHDGAGLRGKAEAVHVHIRPRARTQEEAAAVEVDEHRQLLPGLLAVAGRGQRLVPLV